VTCRDWFQLSLKEGLTVFRDQCFTADHHSATVKRIQDVELLRHHQFPEDAGPMAHPIRPDSYLEINNFYTVTVYEKGAEVIRMMHTLLGDDAYQAGIALYFERHDGSAVTCDDFVDAMQSASGIDLSQFRQWYAQAGTPEVSVQGHYEPSTKRYTLTMQQRTPDTPGQSDKPALLIPIDIALLDSSGAPLALNMDEPVHPTAGGGALLRLTAREQSWQFHNVESAPELSLLRQFSAPVKAEFNYSGESLGFLMAHDTDEFNRWEASQRLAHLVIGSLQQGSQDYLPAYLDALANVFADDALDDAFKAEMLIMPSFEALALPQPVVDVHATLSARRQLLEIIAKRFEASLRAIVDARPVHSLTHQNVLSDSAMAQRALANTALSLLAFLPAEHWLELAKARYDASATMTDRIGALTPICNEPGPIRDACLADFHAKFSSHKLVIDKWFSLQAAANYPGVIADVQGLSEHPSFDAHNPNRLRSLYGAFAFSNPTHFHAHDGSGYAWIADAVLAIDEKNPQVAARLVTPLTHWRRYEEHSATLIKQHLQRIADTGTLSPNVYELVTKGLKAA